MWRSVAAVAVGFVVMAVLVLITTVVSVVVMEGRLNPGFVPKPTTAFIAVNLAFSLLAAVVGGWTCVKIAKVNPIAHIVALVVVVIGMAVLTARMPQPDESRQPPWYPYAVTALGVAGVCVGGAIGGRKPAPEVEPGSGLIS